METTRDHRRVEMENEVKATKKQKGEKYEMVFYLLERVVVDGNECG